MADRKSLFMPSARDQDYMKAAEDLANRLQLDQVVILGRRTGSNGEEVLFAHGRTDKDAAVAKTIAETIKRKVMQILN